MKCLPRSREKISTPLALFALTLLLLPSAAGAGAAPLECPASISQKSLRLVDIPTGWTAFSASPLYLHGAAPMNGPPEELGELSDYKQKRGKNEWVYTYQLDGQFPAGKWLSCTYGESDQVTLSKRLDDGIQVCTFTYRKGRYIGQNDIVIACK